MVDPSNNSAPYSPVAGAPYAEKEVNHQTGLEVDHTQDGLRTVSDTAGLEAVPAEHQKGAFLQTNYEGAQKEAWNDVDKEIVSPYESKQPGKWSILKRRWKLWALLAALLIIIVVVAVAVPLSIRHGSRYVCILPMSQSTARPADQCSFMKYNILCDQPFFRNYLLWQYFFGWCFVGQVELQLDVQSD